MAGGGGGGGGGRGGGGGGGRGGGGGGGVKEPRQGILVGTTNRKAYLADDTGNRRFWPIEAGVIDIEGFNAVRDQLFAEAMARRRENEQWWPYREVEEMYFGAEQDARYEADVWEPVVLAKLAEGIPMTLLEAAINVKEVEHFTKSDQNRVTAIMERAGWIRRHVRGHQGARVWIPPGTPNPKPTKPGSRRETVQRRS